MNVVSLTLKSGNAKTGPIPVSTSTKAYCPDACSLKDNGCYADSGPLRMHWDKVSGGERGMSWDAFCDAIHKLPLGTLWRHNQAGDLPGDGKRIDSNALCSLLQANTGRRGFTYTHYSMDIPGNRLAVQYANEQGFTINLSAESLQEADELKALGIAPVVTILPEDAERSVMTPAGNRVVTCPATYRDDVSCATCQLCQRQREVIVGFPVHGNGKRKAAKVIAIKSIH